jgi:hypothetical protein
MATHEYIDSIKNDILPTLTSISADDKLVLVSYLNEASRVHSRELHRLLEQERNRTRTLRGYLMHRINNLKALLDPRQTGGTSAAAGPRRAG